MIKDNMGPSLTTPDVVRLPLHNDFTNSILYSNFFAYR